MNLSVYLFELLVAGNAMFRSPRELALLNPQPNCSRHEWARWDAYIATDDPDSLYTEFVGRQVPMHRELANTSDGLRAFEITDNSGYVLCFGRLIDK